MALVRAGRRVCERAHYHTEPGAVVVEWMRGARAWAILGRTWGDWDGVSARGAASIPGVTLSGVGASGGIRGAWVHGHGFGLLTPYCAVTLRSSARE